MIKFSERKVIDCSDWDNLVEKTYGKPYTFQQQDGCQSRGIVTINIPEDNTEEEAEMNDSIPEIINSERSDEMGVKFDVWLARDLKSPLNPSKKELESCNYYYSSSDRKQWCEDKSHINMFYERNFYPNLQTVANDLYKKGLIEAGEYDIKIYW